MKIQDLSKHCTCINLTFSQDLLRASATNVLAELQHLSVNIPHKQTSKAKHTL
jgi:hypothetical protein